MLRKLFKILFLFHLVKYVVKQRKREAGKLETKKLLLLNNEKK